MPAARSRTRRLWLAPQSSEVRVHHFVPGIGIIAASGGAGVLTRADVAGVWLSATFGAGLALTLDEVALLLRRENAYWTSERLALSQAGVAAATALGVGARVYRRGSQDDDSRGPHIRRERHG